MTVSKVLCLCIPAGSPRARRGMRLICVRMRVIRARSLRLHGLTAKINMISSFSGFRSKQIQPDVDVAK